jgi:glycine/D-amino acid oxidase-like deaminating enzyme
MLWIAADDEEMAEVHAKHTTYRAAGIRSVVMDGRELAAEPNLRSGLLGALLVPDDAVLPPPVAAGYFLQEAVKHGAVLLQRQAVIEPAREWCNWATAPNCIARRSCLLPESRDRCCRGCRFRNVKDT